MSTEHDQSETTKLLVLFLIVFGGGIYSYFVHRFLESLEVGTILVWAVALAPPIGLVTALLWRWGRGLARWALGKPSKDESGKPEKAKDALSARTQALAIMQGDWDKWYQPPGEKREHEIVRIDSSGNYYTHSPGHGYSLDGEPKYVMRSIDYDVANGIITLQNVKPMGEETKHETLKVVNNDLLVGCNTYDKSHILKYRRTTHDVAQSKRGSSRHV